MNQEQPNKQPDDFRQIKGIGPVTEGRLHEANIYTYAQLTAVSPQTLAELLPGFTPERIQQEDWHGQAEALAASQESTAGGSGQHYATFTVELLLDQDNTVRRTRAVHVQQEENKKSWPGWQPGKLKKFIARHAQVARKSKTPANAQHEQATAVSATKPPPEQPATTPAEASQLYPESIDELTMRFLQPASRETPETAVPPEAPAKETAVQPKPAPQPLSVELNTPNNLLEHGHAFNVQLLLNLAQLSHERQTPLNYQAAVYAYRLDSKSRLKVGTAYGAIPGSADQVAINVPTQIGTPGTYRLEAEMAIAWIPATPDITTNSTGGLLHVY